LPEHARQLHTEEECDGEPQHAVALATEVARPPSSDEQQRITSCAAPSLGWEPGAPATPSFEQAKAF
jgi:hypothetical protein